MLYCHSRGVVHRDLKLENVLFKYKEEDEFTVKVVDFGIATETSSRLSRNQIGHRPLCALVHLPPYLNHVVIFRTDQYVLT